MVTSIVQKSKVDISKRACKPGVTAVQLTLQPVLVVSPSVMNISLTILVLVVTAAGREEPQLFSIKVVPSPSVIVRWSLQEPEEWISKAENVKERMSPCSTSIISVRSRLLG